MNVLERIGPSALLTLGVLFTLAAPHAARAAASPTPTPFAPIGVGVNPDVAAPAPQATADAAQATPPPEPAETPTPEPSPRASGPSVGARTRHFAPTSGPIRELSQLRWMVGNWTAHLRPPSGLRPRARPADESIYVFAYTMGGRWLFGSDGRGRDLLYLTYDPAGEQWVMVRIGVAPSYEILSSKGWRNGRLTFTSAQAPGEMRRRISFIHLFSGQFALFEERARTDAAWMPIGERDFTRAR